MLFLRYFSDELRKPISNISVGLAFIKVEIKNSTDQDLVGTVQQAVQSCEESIQILDNILLYDKLSTNSLTMYMKRIPIMSFIRSTIRPFLSMVSWTTTTSYLFSLSAVTIEIGRKPLFVKKLSCFL